MSFILFRLFILLAVTRAMYHTTACRTNKRSGGVVVKMEDQTSDLQLLLGSLLRRHRQLRRPTRCATLLTDPRHSSLTLTSTPQLRFTVRDNTSLVMNMLRSSRLEDCSVVVIFMENARQLSRILRRADRNRLITSDTHLILLRDTRLFSPLMHSLWRRMVNVIFVEKSVSCFQLSSVSFPEPVDPDHPETWQPRHITTWCQNRTDKLGPPIFSDKTQDLQEQPVRVIYYQHVPAVTAVPSEIEPAIPGITLHGVEIELVALLARAMRFAVQPKEVSDSSEAVTAVSQGHADLALASVPHVLRYLRRLDLTRPYAAHCYTFLTPEVVGDRSWQALLIPLAPDLWLATAGAFLVTWLALHAVARLQARRSVFSGATTSLLCTWSMQLLVSLPSPPQGWPVRLLFGCAWVQCLLLAVSYRASFASQLASPPPRYAVNSLVQLARAEHIEPITWTRHARELLENSDDESSQRVGARLRESRDSEEDVVTLVATGKVAFLENVHLVRDLRQRWQNRTGDSAGRYTLGSYRLHVMEECVFTLPVSLGLARNSALTARVGLVLQRAVEMGLTAKWSRDVTHKTRLTENEEDSQQQALVNLHKLAGAFVALAIGCTLGSLSFLAELLHFQYLERRHSKERNLRRQNNSVVTNMCYLK